MISLAFSYQRGTLRERTIVEQREGTVLEAISGKLFVSLRSRCSFAQRV